MSERKKTTIAILKPSKDESMLLRVLTMQERLDVLLDAARKKMREESEGGA